MYIPQRQAEVRQVHKKDYTTEYAQYAQLDIIQKEETIISLYRQTL